MNNYYAVTCKCGHVGRKNYILITFPVVANTRKEAASIARNIPRCKHHHKDCIREVVNTSYADYLELEEDIKNDPYLKCKCVQDQKEIDISNRIIPEENKHFKKEKEQAIRKVFYKKTMIRHPKKYFRFIDTQLKTFDLRSLSC